MSLNETLTLIVAVYAAVVSTILGVRELQRDRRRISMILEYVEFRHVAQLVITNIGLRPITIVGVAVGTGTTVDGKTQWQGVPSNALLQSDESPNAEVRAEKLLPATLGDGEHVILPLSSVLTTEVIKSFHPGGENNVKIGIRVYDAEGHEYRKFRTRVYNYKWGYYRKVGEF